ncbi:hypothetical protein BKA63DRAFT_502800 [Paraphoma chrysanthemicola]|nr:hypothetical protein BKA63DRAFT_502800 [Paraphoma chrysanthemicola]
MSPRTRRNNSNVDYKDYYSKKVPQQAHFPHRRKTVRRPVGLAEDKRQVKFLPEMMKIKRVDTVGDSEEEDEDLEEDVEDGGASIALGCDKRLEYKSAYPTRTRRRRCVEDEDEAEGDDEEGTGPTSKRRRISGTSKESRPSKRIESILEVEDKPSRRTKAVKSRSLRRQSTMTQLVEGRAPPSDTEEPAFKPVKRSPRLSWSGQGKKAKDNKQRTLTQMIPGMRPLEILSDEDIEERLSDDEAHERDSQAYSEAITARLAKYGLMKRRVDDTTELNDDTTEACLPAKNEKNEQGELANDTSMVPLAIADSAGHDSLDDDEDSYRPTQFIDETATMRTRSTRRSDDRKRPKSLASKLGRVTQQNRKSKFSLLSSPEKRQVHEIASSQSPPGSPLSTQVTPTKLPRSPLNERSGNVVKVAETPSKRKQVTFLEPKREPTPPRTLRKFRSVIQDSEDEDEDEVFEADDDNAGKDIGAHTQCLIKRLESVASAKDVGTGTQAIHDQIDDACAGNEEHGPDRDSSEELGELIFSHGRREPSPELGEQPSYRAAHTAIKQEPGQEEAMNDGPTVGPFTDAESPISTVIKQELTCEEETNDSYAIAPSIETEPPRNPLRNAEDVASSPRNELPLPRTQVPSSPPIVQQPIEDTCPSTPMVIMGSSDDDDMDDSEPDLTPPHGNSGPVSRSSASAPQRPSNHQDESMQPASSPQAQQETQQSHSSKAEQQLQNEWCSYSQYVKDCCPQPSSMHVGHDTFSYNATPMPPRPNQPAQPSGFHMSQATTVDEVTPKKNRTQRIISASVTPHRMANSQPFFSPSKPPPLVIPSSFPSPAKSRIGDWSSPIFGRTQDAYGSIYHGGSLEDLSIPPPPPDEDY